MTKKKKTLFPPLIDCICRLDFFLFKNNGEKNDVVCTYIKLCKYLTKNIYIYSNKYNNPFSFIVSLFLLHTHFHHTKAALSRSMRVPNLCHSPWWIHSSWVVSRHANTAPPFQAVSLGSMSCSDILTLTWTKMQLIVLHCLHF